MNWRAQLFTTYSLQDILSVLGVGPFQSALHGGSLSLELFLKKLCPALPERMHPSAPLGLGAPVLLRASPLRAGGLVKGVSSSGGSVTTGTPLEHICRNTISPSTSNGLQKCLKGLTLSGSQMNTDQIVTFNTSST